MKTFEIYPLYNYTEYGILNSIVTDQQKTKGKQLWCIRNKKHFLDLLTYECERGSIEDACFNMYANMWITREIFTNQIIPTPSITSHMYNMITNQKIYNRCFWYGVKIFENDKHTDTVCIMVKRDGGYYHTYGGKNDADGWPKEVPESYKSEMVFREMDAPFIPDELNDSNIELKDNNLYVEGKEVNEYGYYTNKEDMYEFQGDYYKPHLGYKLYIHTPFNAINLNLPDIEATVKQYISKYANNLEIYIVGDNTQLSNVTNIRIGGIGFNDECLKLIAKEQQHCIIRTPSTYNVNILYRWKTII